MSKSRTGDKKRTPPFVLANSSSYRINYVRCPPVFSFWWFSCQFEHYLIIYTPTIDSVYKYVCLVGGGGHSRSDCESQRPRQLCKRCCTLQVNDSVCGSDSPRVAGALLSVCTAITALLSSPYCDLAPFRHFQVQAQLRPQSEDQIQAHLPTSAP
jgi:hypothetical protein